MITINITGNEPLILDTDIGILYITQKMIQTGPNGRDLRTVLEVKTGDNIARTTTPDNQIRYIKV